MYNSKLILFIALIRTAWAFRNVDGGTKNVQLPPSDQLLKARIAVPVQTSKKDFGFLNRKDENEYWYNPTIHVLGNVGLMGAFHAAIAPLSTKMIDLMAYDGQDVRKIVANKLSRRIQQANVRVLDLCCGVGISTRALRRAFPNSTRVVGLDTSCQMISMAKFISSQFTAFKDMFRNPTHLAFLLPNCSNTSYKTGNAEETKLDEGSFELVTIMYGFHEVPASGRARIIDEAKRLLSPGGRLAVIDISTDFTPPPSMLAGEPYVLEYQKNIHHQLGNFAGFTKESYETIVPAQVGMWVLKKD